MVVIQISWYMGLHSRFAMMVGGGLMRSANQLPMSFKTALRPMIRVADEDTVRRALSHVSSPIITREAARKVTIQPWNANISHLYAPTMPISTHTGAG